MLRDLLDRCRWLQPVDDASMSHERERRFRLFGRRCRLHLHVLLAAILCAFLLLLLDLPLLRRRDLEPLNEREREADHGLAQLGNVGHPLLERHDRRISHALVGVGRETEQDVERDRPHGRAQDGEFSQGGEAELHPAGRGRVSMHSRDHERKAHWSALSAMPSSR